MWQWQHTQPLVSRKLFKCYIELPMCIYKNATWSNILLYLHFYLTKGKKDKKTTPSCKANICIDVNPVIPLHKAVGGLGSVNWDTQGGGAPSKAHKQSNEKRHQFWHRQPPSHRLGRHNAQAPYLQRQEEGRQICTGWKHSHGRNGQNQLLPSSINVAPTFTVQQLTSNWSYPWSVMTS